jgi:hypothetical protein
MLLESYANYNAASLDEPLCPLIQQELGVRFPELPKILLENQPA